MNGDRFEELEDVLYGKDKLSATVVSIDFDDNGLPFQYAVELHEGYADSLDKVVCAEPDEIMKIPVGK